MNDEIQKRLSTYMGVLEESLKSAKDFTVAEAPLYVRELLLWEFWHNVVSGSALLLVALVVAVAVPLVIRRFFRSEYFTNMHSVDQTGATFMTFMGSGLILVFGFCAPVLNAYARFETALKVSVAPRVVLLEKIQGAISNAKKD